MYSRLNLTFKTGADELSLQFAVRPTQLAQKWAAHVRSRIAAQVDFDRRRFMGFGDPNDEIREGVERIMKMISELGSLHPEIDFGVVDFSDLQAEVNRLHVHFADRHLVKKDLKAESLKKWTEFNDILHRIEFLFKIRDATTSSGISIASAIVSFFGDQPKERLTSEDRQCAVLNREFGCVYLNYSQVGRHILELFLTGNMDLPPEHIQPFELFSADFNIWFGPTRGVPDHQLRMAEIKKWFLSQPIFKEMGLRWSPEDLGIGYFPLASLTPRLFSIREMRDLQTRLENQAFLERIELE